MDATANPSEDKISLATDIVSAYVGNNSVPPAELPALIRSVHSALTGIAAGRPADQAPEAKPTPAQIRKSVGEDGIVSFLDGRTYKSLKRHLSANGFTPERYRERFGLPRDYPVVCASYSARRSELAKRAGLGRSGGAKEQPAEAVSKEPARKTQRASGKAA